MEMGNKTSPSPQPQSAFAPADADFDTRFPRLMRTLKEYQHHIGVQEKEFGSVRDYRKVIHNMFKNVVPKIDSELNEALPLNTWQTLTGYHDGFIALHSINVVYRAINHPIFLT